MLLSICFDTGLAKKRPAGQPNVGGENYERNTDRKKGTMGRHSSIHIGMLWICPRGNRGMALAQTSMGHRTRHYWPLLDRICDPLELDKGAKREMAQSKFCLTYCVVRFIHCGPCYFMDRANDHAEVIAVF